MADVPPGGLGVPPRTPVWNPPTISLDVDAGVGTEIQPAREPAKGCAARSEWSLPLVLVLALLAARAVTRRPTMARRAPLPGGAKDARTAAFRRVRRVS